MYRFRPPALRGIQNSLRETRDLVEVARHFLEIHPAGSEEDDGDCICAFGAMMAVYPLWDAIYGKPRRRRVPPYESLMPAPKECIRFVVRLRGELGFPISWKEARAQVERIIKINDNTSLEKAAREFLAWGAMHLLFPEELFEPAVELSLM